MKAIIRIKQLFILVFITTSFLNVYGQFKADMYYNMGGKERIFKIFSDNENYRYEFNEDGQEGVVISKSGANQIIILMTQQKMAIKSASGNPMSMANDPLKAYEYYNEKGYVKEAGKETVNGIECTKSELWNKDENTNQKMFTVWTSKEYNFPIKVANHIDVTGPTGFELKNIESWTPEPHSFTVPDDYNIIDQQQMGTQGY